MKISKLAVLTALSAFSCLAACQSFPPPPAAGQSYWFGPGPSQYSPSSNVQDTGGYAEMYQSNPGNWVFGATGGPAYAGSNLPSNAQVLFAMSTVVNITPYIYVDGYFGTTANVHGFQQVGTYNADMSRFYVLHNTTIQVAGNGFTNVGLGGPSGTPSIGVVYNFLIADYNNLGYSATASATGGTSDFVVFTVDTVSDGGTLQVDVRRYMTFPSGLPSGQYSGTANVLVTSV